MPASRRRHEPALNRLRRGGTAATPASQGFAPIARHDARVLVLGSLPGQRSLQLAQYYGQPQNAFWRILADLTGVPAEADYAARVAGVLEQRIAVWDVVASAVRPGSLDADIDRRSVVANDFHAFFAVHARIERICCNGATAAALYRRLVLPQLASSLQRLPLRVLPSTSPAHASLSLAAKRSQWLAALRPRD
jgi:hypoxanthine-DNA glycosylase